MIILDLQLPGRDGIDVLKTIRRESIHTPVLIMTARDTVDERVLGLDSGAEVTLAWVNEDETMGSVRYVIGSPADERSYYAKADHHDHVVTVPKFTGDQATGKKAEDFIKKAAAAAPPAE